MTFNRDFKKELLNKRTLLEKESVEIKYAIVKTVIKLIVINGLYFWAGRILYDIGGWKIIGAMFLMLTAHNIERKIK